MCLAILSYISFMLSTCRLLGKQVILKHLFKNKNYTVHSFRFGRFLSSKFVEFLSSVWSFLLLSVYPGHFSPSRISNDVKTGHIHKSHNDYITLKVTIFVLYILYQRKCMNIFKNWHQKRLHLINWTKKQIC